jgi:hypothetical protein
MIRVDKVSKPAKGFGSYPKEINDELIKRFGCNGSKGNFEINGEYHHGLICSIGRFISQCDGMYQEYQLWFSEPINSWRLVFGYKS